MLEVQVPDVEGGRAIQLVTVGVIVGDLQGDVADAGDDAASGRADYRR
jgi:hypothetical protein